MERRSDGKTYALKRVNISKMKQTEIADTLNEIRFLSSVRHPYIVGFLEAFLDRNDTELCIIMEYCSYGDLAEKVERYKKRRQYIDEKVIWAYLVQCLEALQHLHAKRICHRDLKPANCFLCDDGTIKIGDMNVSKRMKHGLLKTQIGTPYYMSPEIWANKSYNESSDMWALGCLTYELCGLAPPFVGDSFPQLKKAVLQGRYKAIPRCYSYEMSTVVSKLLRVNANSRPSAADLLQSPEVQKYMKPGGYGAIAPESHKMGPIDLMATIVVPGGPKRRIAGVLPQPCYPDARPNSPTSWPVSARDRSDAIKKKNGDNNRGDNNSGLSAVDESKPETSSSSSSAAAPKPKVASSRVPASPLPIRANGGAAKVVSTARSQASRPQPRQAAPEPASRKALAPLNGNRDGNQRPSQQAPNSKPPRPSNSRPVNVNSRPVNSRPANSRQAGARPTAGAAYAPADREGLMKPARPGREGQAVGNRGRPAANAAAARPGNRGAAQVGGGGYGRAGGGGGGEARNYRRGQYSYKPSWWG